MIDTRNRILLSLHLVSKEDDEELNEKDRAYFNAYLLANGGISLVNPEKLTEGVFRKLEPLFPLSVPPSFPRMSFCLNNWFPISLDTKLD